MYYDHANYNRKTWKGIKMGAKSRIRFLICLANDKRKKANHLEKTITFLTTEYEKLNHEAKKAEQAVLEFTANHGGDV